MDLLILTGSNNTKAKDMNVVTFDNFSGSYIHYGIREHGMAGIMNGIALHGGLKTIWRNIFSFF